MKRTAIILFALLMVGAVTSADACDQCNTPFHYFSQRKTSVVEQSDFYKSPEREHIQSDSFRQIYSAKALPKAVREYLGEMANPGEAWQACDLGLVTQQLVFAGVSQDHVIVYYDQGCCQPYSAGRFRFDIFSFKPDFSFDSKSFDTQPLNLYYRTRRRFIHEHHWKITVIQAKDVTHRGSGRTNKKLKTIEELKAAILASRSE